MNKNRKQPTAVMLYAQLFQPYEGWYLRAWNQAKTLTNEGWHVTVLAWDRSGTLPAVENRDGVHIRRIHINAPVNRGPINGINVLRFNLAAFWYLIRHHVDVIQCFNVDTMPGGLAAARCKGKKAVLDLCEPDYYKGFWSSRYNWLLDWINRIEKFFAKRFDHLMVHNTYQIRKFTACGVRHITQVGSYPNQSLLAEEVNTRSRKPVIIGRLGSIYANNGFEEIIAAFQQLVDRHSNGNGQCHYRLFLAGKVFDNYRTQFESLIQPLKDHIDLQGTYNAHELPELYENIDISLLLYGKLCFENVTPTKLFESMARGVPIVANAVGDMEDIVAGMNCGVIVDETRPESICEGIERIGDDFQLRREMAQNGLRLVKERFSWEAIRPDFLDVYHGLHKTGDVS